MGLRHERAAQSNEVHIDTRVLHIRTPVTLYDGEMMTHFYNTADCARTQRALLPLAGTTVHVHKPLLRQQLKVKLYITCLQVVYSKYRTPCTHGHVCDYINVNVHT